MSRDFGKIITISDIHIGGIPVKQLRKELNEEFFNVIQDINDIKMIVVCGDTFDHKLSFNSEDSKLAIEFMEKLANLSLTKNIIIRILRGTKNHDLNQLNNFIYLEKREDINFRIINTVTEESIYGFQFLYIPEEYMEDSNEFYKEYFNDKKYHMVFGHGTFNHVGYVNKSQESERPIRNAPLFSYEQMKKITNCCVFGHIHNASVYKDTIFYNGSFSRWHFGEEDDKGFRIFDLKDNSFKHKFVVNKLARQYVTLHVDSILRDEDISIEERIKKIEKIKNDKSIHKLRIKFNNVNGDDDLETAFVREYFAKNNNDNVIVSVTNVSKENEKEEEQKLQDEYSFVFNKEFEMPKIISMYLEKHDGIKLDENIIQDILNEEV